MGLSSAFWLRRIAQPLPRRFAVSKEVFSPLNGTPPCSTTMFTAISLEDAAFSNPCPLTTSTVCLRRPTFRAWLLFALLRSTCVRAPCLRYRPRVKPFSLSFGAPPPTPTSTAYAGFKGIACSNWGEYTTELLHTIVPCLSFK